MSETYSIPRPAELVEVWPPDDTEESVMGTDLHQLTIINLRLGMDEIATSLTPVGEPAPWQPLSQTIVNGFERLDGSRYKTLPDVFVYLRPIGRRRGSVEITVDGLPLLIVEVLSESTYAFDLNMRAGKGYSYARAGVREYLVVDPTGEILPQQARGWRLDDGKYRLWNPDATGRWRSEQIEVCIGVEGAMAAVYTRDGRRQPRSGEVTRELARQESELARQHDELARKDSELARKDSELAGLRRLVEELRRDR